MKLLELSENLNLLYNLIGEELTEEQQLQLGEITMALEAKLQDKAESIVQFANSLTCDISQIDDEIKRLQALKKSRKGKAERLKEFLIFAMKRADTEEINTPTMTIKLKKLADKITITAQEELSEQFLRIPEPKAPEPDKRALLAEFKKTGVIPSGCKIETDRKGLNVT